MELPVTCSHCQKESLLDWESLDQRPVSKLYTVEGFLCPHCQHWEACWFTTLSLRESMRKLDFLNPNRPDFYYHFVKTLNRAKEIQRRGLEAYGALGHQNLALAG